MIISNRQIRCDIENRGTLEDYYTMAELSHRKEESEQENYKYRTSLPAPAISKNDVSLWSFVKNLIGKDLSKLTVPVTYNEPLSFLQRISEYTEYMKLLTTASEHEDPIDRMKYVAGFAVAALASNWGRVGKPFNPLLGETYELQRPDFRILCEQVSHKPSVSAFHADSKHFSFHGSIRPKLKFLGKGIDVRPKGVVTAELFKWDEAYTWSNVNCVMHNVVVGKMWVEHRGTLEILNHKLGLRAVLTFKPAGRAAKDLHKVEGFIIDKEEKKLHFVYGKWTEFIACTDINSYNEYTKKSTTKFQTSAHSISSNESSGKNVNETSLEMSSLSIQELDDDSVPDLPDGEIPKSDSTYSMDIPGSFNIWTAYPRPSNTSQFYQFTLFALSLNEILPEMKAPNALCSTDSRLRPDIRKLECGDIDGATMEKARLEEKQRQAKKARKLKKVDDYTPRWFSYAINPHTKQDDWMYTGEYWNRKCETSDIF